VPAPKLGTSTAEILRSAGLSQDEIERLARDGAIKLADAV
jgi:crotonobetainyl-CoA:carnitine CoA-transferase CaiB-like acyl-CoA transferase